MQLSGPTLVVPGLIAVVLGLFLWLGGTRYSAIVIGLLGAAVGAASGVLISSWFDVSMASSVLIGAVLLAIAAVLLQQAVITLLAIVIFALICAMVYTGFAVENHTADQTAEGSEQQPGIALPQLPDIAPLTKLPGSDDGSADTDPSQLSTIGDARTVAIEKLKDAWQTIKASASANRGFLVLWTIVGAAVGLFLAFVLKKLMMALCCSIVGSAAVLSGILTLLLAKGTEVLSSLSDRPRVLPAIFIAMVVFGWLTQLLLVGSRKSPGKSDKEQA